MKTAKVEENASTQTALKDTQGTVNTSIEMVNASLAQAVLTATQRKPTTTK